MYRQALLICILTEFQVEKYQVSRGMYPYVAENLCDILEDAGFTEIKKSVKQQAFCSSDSVDKGMELTGYENDAKSFFEWTQLGLISIYT